MVASAAALKNTKWNQERGRFRVARDRARGFAALGADEAQTAGTSSREEGPLETDVSESLGDDRAGGAAMDVDATTPALPVRSEDTIGAVEAGREIA